MYRQRSLNVLWKWCSRLPLKLCFDSWAPLDCPQTGLYYVCVVVCLIDTYKCSLQPTAVCVCVCVCALGLVWPEITQRAHPLFSRILVSHCLWGEQLTAYNLCGKALKMKHFLTQPRVWVCLCLRWTETYFCWNSSSRSAIPILNK